MAVELLSFEDVISYESLYRAHRRARLGKRHKKEVVEFELDLSKNLWELHYDLKYNRYEIGGYHKFMIYDPKEREIQAISYRDRVVQHALCDNYLTPLLESKYIYDNSACRKNKGTHFALDRLSKFMREFHNKYGKEGYFVKLDMAKYFNSIDHGVLKQKLRRVVGDDKILALCEKVIDSYNFESGKGLPMGNQSSQNFALLYLNEFDHFMKEQMGVKYYVRYMDDIVMIVRDRAFARELIWRAKAILEPHLIKLNHKSQIIPFSNGVIFLGWKMFYGGGKVVRKVKKQLKTRILQKIRGKICDRGCDIQASIVSYRGMLLHGDAVGFFNFICISLRCGRGFFYCAVRAACVVDS